MIIEYIVFGYKDLRAVAGEWVVFMCLAIYLAVDCTRNGIFDRRLKPTAKTYIGSGIIGGVIAGLIMGIAHYNKISNMPNYFGNEEDDILIQEYIEGDEYVVNTISCQGKHIITDV